MNYSIGQFDTKDFETHKNVANSLWSPALQIQEFDK